jgi:glyoxylase-like metal-dependent hydrolase (beta-lactamase superfamily II)
MTPPASGVELPAGMTVIERGWLSSNTVVCRGLEPAIIDTGYASHADFGVQVIRRALQGQPPARIVNTHLHSDHCGGNAALQAAWPGVETWIPSLSLAAARDWDAAALTFEATGQRCDRFSVDRGFAPGDRLRLGDLHFDALAAPGHDPQMMVLWCADERLLISADALWQDGFGVIFPEIEGEPGFDDLRATLDLIDSLGATQVIPGHGAPFTDVEAAMARARSRLARFEADPTSHARHALKVLVKFLLMDVGTLSIAQLDTLPARMRYVEELNRRFMRLSSPELGHWIAAALVKSGVARLDPEGLHDIA